jgi:hypothetical protein
MLTCCPHYGCAANHMRIVADYKAGALNGPCQGMAVVYDNSFAIEKKPWIFDLNRERWLGRLDSNQGMAVPKTAALPLGYAPTDWRDVSSPNRAPD